MSNISFHKDENKETFLSPQHSSTTIFPVQRMDSHQNLTDAPSKLARSSNLDSTISKIGFGKFQKQILFLCGLGWLADNMWLQSVAIILPRVQQQFQIGDSLIGLLSSSIFVGMMAGSLFWGLFSDNNGRKSAFKWTLVVAGSSGILSSFSPNFFVLCVMFMLLGFGVGGNMPVDGALFLEFIPAEKKYLLTFLSVFFSFGAVVSSLLAWIILPAYSCVIKQNLETIITQDCNIQKDNNGWRYLLFTLGVANLGMVAARVIFFTLPESPKYLFTKNRHDDILTVLRKIITINGSHMEIEMKDVEPFKISSEENKTYSNISFEESASNLVEIEDSDQKLKILQKFGLKINSETILQLFTKEYRFSTILIWSIWIFVNLGYTMFNVFLPKYMELTNNKENNKEKHEMYSSYFLYSLCGIPGSIIGSYMVETKLGRKGAMFIATIGVSICLFLFTYQKSSIMMLIFSGLVNFLATIIYAILYAYTPEVFESSVRGTACGIASALGRVAGIIAPLITGMIFVYSPLLSNYLSALLFVLVATLVFVLPIETRTSSKIEPNT